LCAATTSLVAAPRVPTGCLQMASGVRADPDVSPGRRDREAFDALDIDPCSKLVTSLVHVAKASSFAMPPNTGTAIVHIYETRGLCRFDQFRRPRIGLRTSARCPIVTGHMTRASNLSLSLVQAARVIMRRAGQKVFR
jgi:hypothetical protein